MFANGVLLDELPSNKVVSQGSVLGILLILYKLTILQTNKQGKNVYMQMILLSVIHRPNAEIDIILNNILKQLK